MTRAHKRNFLLVTELRSKTVKEVLEGPDERELGEKDLHKVDQRFFETRRKLTKKFPLENYDLIVARADDLQSLRRAFPEFTGWNKIHPKSIQ